MRYPWGSKRWKAHPQVARHCIYDRQLVYRDIEKKWASHTEIRQLGLDVADDLESGLSDHLPVSVIYREAEGFSAAIARLKPENFTTREVRDLVKQLKFDYGRLISDQTGEHTIDEEFSGVNPLCRIAECRTYYKRQPVIVHELDRLEKVVRQSMNPVAGTPGSNTG